MAKHAPVTFTWFPGRPRSRRHHRRGVALLTAAALLGGATAATAVSAPPPPPASAYPGHWTPDPLRYGITVQKGVQVTMPDGTVLVADIYRPSDEATGRPAAGRFPVLLAQTPYGRSSVLTTGGDNPSSPQEGVTKFGGDGFYPYLIRRGYINVIVDVRGTGASGGTWSDFGQLERQDGVSLVDWSAHLPGSDGRVGLIGGSYLGINQLYTAALVGPHSPLKAIFPVVTANNLYRDIAFSGGLFDQEFLVPWFYSDRLPGDLTGPMGYAPTSPGQGLSAEQQHLGDVASYYLPASEQAYLGGPLSVNNSYWATRAMRNFIPQVVANGIPAFLVGGWYDLFQRGEPLNYAAFQNAYDHRPVTAAMLPGQRVTGRYQLVMGPWYHVTAFLGVRLQQLMLEWYDTWLNGEHTGMAATHTPLHLWLLGANRWVDGRDWPLSRLHVAQQFFGPGPSGTAPQSVNDGTLSTVAVRASSGSDPIAFTTVSSPCDRQTLQWDAGLPEEVLYGAGLPGSTVTCADDDRSLAAGALTYTSAPMRQATVLGGPVDVRIYATSTRPDTELVATLEDIAPDGASTPLTAGQLLGVYRAVDRSASWTLGGHLILPEHPFTAASEQPVPTGVTVRYDLEVFPTFAMLAPGHRLRVTITTSDSPHETPNAAQLAQLAGGVYAVQRHLGAASAVTFGSAPAGVFPTSALSWGGCNSSC